MVIPLKKFRLPEEVTSQAVPMLSDRQFVVDKTKLSLEEDKLQRELFWYREELFKSVHGHWREVGLQHLVVSRSSVLIPKGGIGGWDSIGRAIIQGTADYTSYARNPTHRTSTDTSRTVQSRRRRKRGAVACPTRRWYILPSALRVRLPPDAYLEPLP
jgi:hypothetical protein